MSAPLRETSQQPPRSIMSQEIPSDMLPSIEAHVAKTQGVTSAIVSPNTWVVDQEQSSEVQLEASIALGGINKVATGIISANPLHEGAATAIFGDPDRPNAMAFVSKSLSRGDLEAVREKVVDEVNDVLASLQSPHRL